MLRGLAQKRGADYLLLGLITLAVYGRIIGHDFINWDDENYVLLNKAVQGFSWPHLHQVFTTSYLGNFAPLHMVSYMFDYTLWGLRPGGFLFTNLVLHLLNGLLWYRMLSRWYHDRLLALVAACLFLLHPVQVESVAWISQRKTLLALFFFLVAWDCYCRYRQPTAGSGRSLYAASLATFALALLSKSVVVIFPLMLLCYDACFEKGADRFRLKDKIPYFFLATAGIAFALLSQSQELSGGRVAYHGGSAWYTFLTMLPVLCRYLAMIVWPANLSALYSPLLHTSVNGTVIGAAAFLLLLAAVFAYLYRRDSRIGFWALFWLLGLLPVLQIIPLNTLISDRYLYFPMLGASVLAATGIAHAMRYFDAQHKAATKTLAAGVVLLLATLSFLRAGVWKDSLTLWLDTVEKTPESSRAWGNLGAAYQRLDARAEAVGAYLRGLELYPDNEQILYNLGKLYYASGNYTEAENCFRRLPQGYDNSGIVPLSAPDGGRP